MNKLIHRNHRSTLLSMIKQLRLDAGLSQVDLAEKLKVPQSFVSKYESGERRLDILELRNICKALDTSLIQFVKKLDDIINESIR